MECQPGHPCLCSRIWDPWAPIGSVIGPSSLYPGTGTPNPKHPYTKGLLEALPDVNNLDAPLRPIPGNIPSPLDRPSACVFRTRCPNPCDNCRNGNTEMGLIEVEPGHWVDQCCINCG